MSANIPSFVYFLTLTDWGALLLFFLLWLGIGWWTENGPAASESVCSLMEDFRGRWMQELRARDQRVYDAVLLGGLRQSAAFFASTTFIAIGAVFTLFGHPEQIQALAKLFSIETSTNELWQFKLLVIMGSLSVGFLRFAWSQRLFNYCAVLMGSVPVRPLKPGEEASSEEIKAANVNARAARAFNSGLRAVYYSLAALAWFAGPYFFAIASLSITLMLYRREFRSSTRTILLG